MVKKIIPFLFPTFLSYYLVFHNEISTPIRTKGPKRQENRRRSLTAATRKITLTDGINFDWPGKGRCRQLLLAERFWPSSNSSDQLRLREEQRLLVSLATRYRSVSQHVIISTFHLLDLSLFYSSLYVHCIITENPR